MDIPVGISACVLGDKVRFDGGHKRSRFAAEELNSYVKFVPVCPEVGIGMPVPRQTIRLLQHEEQIRLVATKDASVDFTDQMTEFAQAQTEKLQHLCGYIVCAKSPTCGMERVKLYIENGNTVPGGTAGIFTQILMEKMPWLPVEEDGRLNDPYLKENFIFRVYALHDLYQAIKGGITAKAIIKFHSRYKLCLMAHSQPAYRELGRFVAEVSQWDDLDAFFVEYRQRFMDAIKHIASRKNNTNVLLHIQGYFKRELDKEQKEELRELIMRYRCGDLPLIAPLTLINHHLSLYPDEYLASQAYLNPYPENLRLRYAL
ncbi:DUF1722 domain-containing protein [Photobacterium damselae]|nr:DUF1722 domain-containing protein [Photobacterium damselae]